MRRVGATLHRGARASHYRSLSCWGAQAPDAQAQQLRLTGPAAPWHVGSSQTRARTRVPCTGRQILNHCATREAQIFQCFYILSLVNKRWLSTCATPPSLSPNIQLWKRIKFLPCTQTPTPAGPWMPGKWPWSRCWMDLLGRRRPESLRVPQAPPQPSPAATPHS